MWNNAQNKKQSIFILNISFFFYIEFSIFDILNISIFHFFTVFK